MSTLVTGAAGFIGTNLVRSLNEAGETVIAVDNFDPYYDPKIKRHNAETVSNLGVDIVEADIRDAESMNSIVRDNGVSRIVNLAGKAGVRASIADPAEYAEVNVMGNISLLEAARNNGVERFVLASTSSLYSDCDTIPFPETHEAIQPVQPYAASKRGAELLGYTYSTNYGLSFASTRFFTVYGPHGRPDMMPYRLAESVLTGRPVTLFDGPLARDWTHVDDICSGLMCALEARGQFEVFNLGRGKPEPLSRFIAVLAEVAGKSPVLEVTERPPTEMLTTFADIGKARSLLGYDPKIDIEDGVQHMWDWYVSKRPDQL